MDSYINPDPTYKCNTHNYQVFTVENEKFLQRIVGKYYKLDIIERIKPGRAYLIHMSDRMGLHADSPKLLPAGVELAYDGLIVKV